MRTELTALAKDPTLFEIYPDPAGHVISTMEHAKQWLGQLELDGDLTRIVELRSQAEAIRRYTGRAQLSKDAHLAAEEMVRRAERAIATGIRRGQEAGTIRSPKSHTGNQFGREHDERGSPTDYATIGALAGDRHQGKPGYYHLADGVTDEQFEKAIAEARAEGSLKRASVYRKIRHENYADGWIPDIMDRSAQASVRRRELIRDLADGGYSSRQISEQIGTLDQTVRSIARDSGIDIPADRIVGKTHRHDGDRIVEEVTHILDGATMSLGLVSPGDLDPAQVRDWAVSLTRSTRAINRFARTITKETIPSDNQD
jgi:hypothetical protein